ncbi:MAG: 16S rRNA (guanine(527)-N(7))-methyltransferase RsmG [Clostridia bacterium]|nr:16S rRNA (guanine(527)-N(7))-methyltransferase RsmG [Clostridia bacterium]
MKSDSNVLDFKFKLKQKALENNIVLKEEMLEKFKIYKDLLIEWNEKMNLTAITDEDEVIVKHFVDCLECTKYIDERSSVADIGTGAGFPGIVISIFFEDKVRVTLIDALNKRLIFLEEVTNKLDLKNINIVHARAEELGINNKHRESYDIVVARAVASLNILLEYTTPYAKIGGKCLLMKGDNCKAEIEQSIKALKELNCKITNEYTYTLELLNENISRSIVEILKIKSTPVKYPRIYAKIKKQPL